MHMSIFKLWCDEGGDLVDISTFVSFEVGDSFIALSSMAGMWTIFQSIHCRLE